MHIASDSIGKLFIKHDLNVVLLLSQAAYFAILRIAALAKTINSDRASS